MPPERLPAPAHVRAGRELAAQLLAAGLRVRLRVTGASMAPTLIAGAEVELSPCTAAPVPGALVYVQVPDGGFVLHRVLRRLPGGRVQTRGDACWRLDDPVDLARVLGVVNRVRHQPHERWSPMAHPVRARVSAWAALARSWLAYRVRASRAGGARKALRKAGNPAPGRAPR